MIKSGLYNNQLEDFTVVGINYRKSAADVRGMFAISEAQYQNILAIAPQFGLHDFFILSTCNRTEIYGCVQQIELFVQLILSQSSGSEVAFRQMFYVKRGSSAIRHFFEVGSGLDSQILGDYEIVGQIKKAIQTSKEKGFVSSFTERLFNHMMQASKAVKNHTKLSDGTMSVSYSVVQYLKEKVDDLPGKRIVLVGTGEIGTATCHNLVNYLQLSNITLINRTGEKADALAVELGLRSAPMARISDELRNADIVIVSTGGEQPLISAAMVDDGHHRFLIDMAIPFAVEKDTGLLDHITLVNVDQLSVLTNKTMEQRLAEIPKAKEIIDATHQEFIAWYANRKKTAVLNNVRHKLEEISHQPEFRHTDPAGGNQEHAEIIQKVINGMACKMKEKNQCGCQYLEAINEFMSIAGK